MPVSSLAQARALLDAGKSRDALAVIEAVGSLADLVGADARIVAGRVARNLGAPRLGRCLHLRSWRSARSNLEAQAAGWGALVETRNYYFVWQRLRHLETPDQPGAGVGAQQLWLLRARIAAGFRDFDSAEQFWRRAERIDPQNPALHVTLASMLQFEDRFAEALAAAHRALELRPWHPSGVRASAHLLQLLDRDAESLSLLKDASERIQDVRLLRQLAELQSALDQHAEALATLDAIARLSPILEKSVRQWLLAFRARVAWRAGDTAAAGAAAREIGEPAWLQFAERSAAGGGNFRRVQLPVPFVAQHQDTCAPATLSALSAYWDQPIGQLEVAEDICYTGTPAHRSRDWAERQGWIVREFTVTWAAAKTLLDRGVPFELSTFSATSGHAQAVIGYDEVQRTFVVRDPNYRHLLEYSADALLEQERATGPGGMAFTPLARSALLDALDLPDGELRTQLHLFSLALDRHCRDEAARILETLQAAAPEHPLVLQAVLSLAWYDGDSTRSLSELDRLLELFPDNGRLLLWKLDSLRERDQRDERLALLREVCSRREAPPIFLLRYAEELTEDAREFADACYWARRALRNGARLGGVSCLAGLLWMKQPSLEALELYRFAACLNDKNEGAARQYFHAARHLNQTEQAILFLRARFARFGHKSSLPAISLFAALDELGHRSEAMQVLEAALERRPDDGPLRLFAAQVESQSGRYASAEEHLRAAEGRAARSQWYRTAAALAARRDDFARALALWREVLDREPLALDAHTRLAHLLAETEGRSAALRHLEQVCAKHPRHFGLHQLRLSWLRQDGPGATEPILLRLIELNPMDAGTRRDWARCLVSLGRWSEALQEANLAIEVDPTHPAGHTLRGWILKSQGQLTDAQAAYRRAISLAVDYDPAMAGLIDCCRTILERRLALNFLQTELSRHLIYGDGLLAFRELAARHLEARELLKFLQRSLSERPDLWHAWAAVLRELTAQEQLDHALELAERATGRLPFSAALWREVASLHQSRNDPAAEIAALEKALALSPGEAESMRRLADACARAGQTDRARIQLEEVLRLYPRDAGACYLLAMLDWKLGQKAHAVDWLKQALGADPGFSRAWDMLGVWARSLNQPALVLETAQALARQRSSDPNAWLRLARLLWDANRSSQAVQAVDRAIALHPRFVEAHDLRAWMLAAEERFTDALNACQPSPWGATPPPELRARAAWIAERQGRRGEAIEAMRAVIDEAPHLIWAWEALASWYLQEGNETEARAAMERLRSAAPNDLAPYLWAATWRQGAEDYPEATELLERALALDSQCVAARVKLLVIQLATNQFNALAETVAALRHQGIEDWARAAEACAALIQRDVGLASARFRELCSMPDADPGTVSLVSDMFKHSEARGMMERFFEEALSSAVVHPDAGALWVEACRENKHLPSLKKLLALRDRGEAGQRAVVQFLRYLSSDGTQASFPARLFTNAARRRMLRRLDRKLGPGLKNDSETWGEFAAALANNRRRSAARRWIGDWRLRQDLRPALPSLFEAFCELGRDAEAIEIGQRAARQAPGRIRSWILFRLAWLQANSGDAKAAAVMLADVMMDSSWAPARVLIDGVIRARQAPPAERAQQALAAYRQARKQVPGSYVANSGPFTRRAVRQSATVLASQGAGIRARIWGARISRRLFH